MATASEMAKQFAEQMGLRLTSGTRSLAEELKLGGSKRSMHVSGQAFDFAGSKTAMKSFANWAKASGLFTEVLYETAGHYDHVHVGWGEGKHAHGKTYVGDKTLIDRKPEAVTPSIDVGGQSGENSAEKIFSSTVRVLLVLGFIILGIVFFAQAFPVDIPLPQKKLLKGLKK